MMPALATAFLDELRSLAPDRAAAVTDPQALAKAEALQSASLFLGDPETVNTNWRRYLAVTAADVRRIAAIYFRPENSLVLLITPGAGK